MQKRVVLVVLGLLFLLPGLFAAQPSYQSGKIIKDVEKKSRSRVLYYVVDTPVMTEDRYYEISVQVKDTVYVGEYQPENAEDTLPDEWAKDQPLQVAIEKRHMLLQRPSGTDLQTVIIKHFAVSQASQAAPEDKAQNQ